MNKIACIISVYRNDGLEYLKAALESLYAQTYSNIDIYVQCDGVLPSKLDKYLDDEFEKDNIFSLSKRNQNKGLARSLNDLLEKVLKCNYKYIARMDADDICVSSRIEKQFNFMEQNTNVDICGTYIEEFGDQFEYCKTITYPLEHNDMLNFFKNRVPVAHVSVFFRNSFFKKAGLYPVSNHISNEDTMLWAEGFKKGCRFANINIIGLKVRVSKNFLNRRCGMKKVISDFKNRLHVIKLLKFGPMSYLFALAMLVINILPANLKIIAYKYLRS